MNIATLCIGAVMITAPAANYHSWISPEIAESVKNCIVNGEYREYLDYNGDGNLTIADVISIEKRYQSNNVYGNTLEFTKNDVREIIEENYAEYPLEWEICSINNDPCCCYDLTVSEVTNIEIYFEWENSSEVISVELNPIEEKFKVLS